MNEWSYYILLSMKIQGCISTFTRTGDVGFYGFVLVDGYFFAEKVFLLKQFQILDVNTLHHICAVSAGGWEVERECDTFPSTLRGDLTPQTKVNNLVAKIKASGAFQIKSTDRQGWVSTPLPFRTRRELLQACTP